MLLYCLRDRLKSEEFSRHNSSGLPDEDKMGYAAPKAPTHSLMLLNSYMRTDNHLRGLLYEAATVILTRTSPRNESRLRTWGLELRERVGFKRAAVAVARKLAVIMHSMLKTGEVFDTSAGATA